MLWRRASASDFIIVAIAVDVDVAVDVAIVTIIVTRTIAGGMTGTVGRIVAIEIVAPVAGISSLLLSSSSAPAPATAEETRTA